MQPISVPTSGHQQQQSQGPSQSQQSQQSQVAQASQLSKPQSQLPSQSHPISPNEARSARRRVAASARKRIANACLACKSRKQKCDGQQPCNICSRRGAACIYVEQPARNTKGRTRRESTVNGDNGEGSVVGDDEAAPTPTGGNGTGNVLLNSNGLNQKQNHQQQQQQNHQKQQQNQQQQRQQSQGLNTQTTRNTSSPISPGQSQSNTQHMLSIRSERLDSVASSDHTDPQFSYPTPTNPKTQSLASGTEASDELDTDDDKVEAPVDHRTRMLSDPSGRLLYIGETGSLSFLARVRKLAKDALGPSSFTSDSAQFSIVDKPIIRSHHLPSNHASLPPIEVASTLVDLFFTHVNSVYYVLDQSEMDQILAVVYAGQLLHSTITARNRDIGFVNAVCAIGTFFLCPTGGQQEQQQAQQDGMLYFDVARSMLEDVYESADFWSIRLLLLFALYMQYAAKRNAAWTYVGLAIRIAESLGLHRIWSIELSEKPLEERRRRLVFWSLYVLDRFTGCSLGRPLAIEDENCNDPVFSTAAYTGDDLLDNRCSQDQGQEQHQVHLLAANVRLNVIVGHIVKAVYLRRSISRDVAEGLSEELKAWWQSLPPCAALKQGSGEQVVALHMSYLHAVTLLTRPFLQKVVEASIEEAAQDGCKCKRRGSGKSNAKRKMVRYAAACVLVAERTVTLAHRMRRKGGLPRNDAALIYYIFTSGLVLMFSTLPQIISPRSNCGPSGEDDITKFRSRSPSLLSLMFDFASVETCTAKRYHSILSQFSDALIEGRERKLKMAAQQQKLEEEMLMEEQNNGKEAERDLLDELQAMAPEYAGGWGWVGSRMASPEPIAQTGLQQGMGLSINAGAAAHANRDNEAAQVLVSVSGGQQIPVSTPVSSSGLDPAVLISPGSHIDHPSPFTIPSVSPHNAHGAQDPHGVQTPHIPAPLYQDNIIKEDTEMLEITGGLAGDFSSFYGWLESGFVENQTIPWEFSWEAPPSNYFHSSRLSPGS